MKVPLKLPLPLVVVVLARFTPLPVQLVELYRVSCTGEPFGTGELVDGTGETIPENATAVWPTVSGLEIVFNVVLVSIFVASLNAVCATKPDD